MDDNLSILLSLEYTTRFCPEFPPIYSLEKLTLVAKGPSQSADLSWQI